MNTVNVFSFVGELPVDNIVLFAYENLVKASGMILNKYFGSFLFT